MNFREQLNKAEELEINPLDLSIAYELECQLDCEEIAISADGFEKACSLIERAYLKSENIKIEDITRALIYMLNEHKLNEIDVWELIQRASYY
jgi:hypothetical protein